MDEKCGGGGEREAGTGGSTIDPARYREARREGLGS